MNGHPSEVLGRIEGADLMKGCEVKKASQHLQCFFVAFPARIRRIIYTTDTPSRA